MKTITRLLVVFLIVFGSTISTGSAAPTARTILVTTYVDEWLYNGECSLREAIFTANNQVASYGCSIVGILDEITILVPDGTYFLTRSGVETMISEYDDLDIVTSLSIMGAGMYETTIDGSDLFRIFDIQAGDTATITINELTIRNGNSGSSAGGGIRNASNLTLNQVRIQSSHAGNYGGGIFHKNDDSVPGSPPMNGQHGLETTLASPALLTLMDCVISGNDADLSGGGIVNAEGSRLLIENTNISSNITNTGNGGGIANISAEEFRMYHSQLQGNSAPLGYGGGLFAYSNNDSFISDTLFYDNSALYLGGNIYHSGSGGILELRRCNIDSGQAHNGGGVAATGGETYFSNTTFALNAASGGENLGGAIYLSTGTLGMMFTKIAENVADRGAGIYKVDGTINIGNTIIAKNRDSLGILNNCTAASTNSWGYNLSDDTSCSLTGTGDTQGVAAGLGVYGRNHGLDPNLRTFDLLPGSPAIDGADPESMIVEDERSFPRTVDGDGNGFGGNDIGAYELQLMFFLPLLMK
jgi:CSLREA domain-containing protein